MKKMLIVYYSWSNGNTKRIAEQLQHATNADIVRITTQTPYAGSYDDVVSQGEAEVKRGYMPPIVPITVDWDAYEVIAVGTPTWWYTMAPAVLTFLSGQDWTGKTVVPFMTHGGWPGHVIADMQTACAGATLLDAQQVQFDANGGDTLVTNEADIQHWVDTIKHFCSEA